MQTRERFSKLAASLDAMSPLKVISRGYSIATTKGGKILKKKTDVSAGDKINVRLSDGIIDCTVD